VSAKPTRAELNAISGAILDAAIAVHTELGPGLLESAYEACLEYELIERGYAVARQRELPLRYKKVNVDCGYRLDLVVNELVIVELKAVERLEPIHQAQVLTYLKLTKTHLGLLMNFNVTRIVDGYKRLVRDFPA
jgi:GxxExxY protein